MNSITRLTRPCYRVAFLASGLSSGLLRRLASGPRPLEALASEFVAQGSMRDGLEAWLQLGVALGKLRAGAEGYRLRGKLSRKLANPANEAAAAFIEETAILDTTFITQTPDRLRRDRPFTRAEWDGRLVARASRVAEPFICEAVDAVIPARGPARLFEVGCGATAYLRHAAARNPEPVFDVATVHQNIYYFPVEKRVEVLRHVRSSLKPGGRLLLTTWCWGRGAGASLLNLWSTMSEGGGRLPTPSEMTRQLAEAGLSGVARWSLIPGESFHAFVGVAPGGA